MMRCLILALALIASSSTRVRAAAELLETKAETVTLLAPSGTLRVALYTGTPTSIVQTEGRVGGPRGVGYDLGKAIAAELSVPFAPIVLSKNADVLEAIRTGAADIAFTNATAARAKDMDFGPTYLEIELGYLVGSDGSAGALAEIDRTGRRIGVTAGSTSDTILSRDLKTATVVRSQTIRDAIAMLRSREIDVFATNKATLFEMAEEIPGSRVLDGRWGVERHAIAIPKGRAAAIPLVGEITRRVIASGIVADAIKRAGLRGAAVAAPQ